MTKIRYFYLALVILAALIITCSGWDHLYFMMVAVSLVILTALLLIALTGRIVQSVALTSALIIVLQLMNQLKVHYYKERLFFSDFYVAADTNNFETLLHYPGALACVLLLFLFLIFSGVLFKNESQVNVKFRLGALAGSVLVGAVLVLLATAPRWQRVWQSSLPKGKGTLVNLYYSAQQLTYISPSYAESDAYFLKKASAHEFNEMPNTETKPDIVVFLQESTFDPSQYQFENGHLPNFEMFKQPYGGLMRVQTFGGKTWLTEFSLLTGLNSDDFGSNKNAVFYSVVPNIRYSLFKELAREGYSTIVLSPMGYANYNAGPSYRALGLKTFYQPQDLGFDAPKNSNLWHISSETMLDYVKKMLNQKSDTPRFILVLSMAEHGPYNTNNPNHYGIEETKVNSELRGSLNDYLGRLDKLNTSTLNFITYLNQRKTPTLFVYFGDHQAALGWHGKYRYPYKDPEYITQFSLVSNYPMTMKNHPLMDNTFLGGLILEKAGIQVSPFYRANIIMRHLCDGKLDDCEDKKLVESFKHYIYDSLSAAQSEISSKPGLHK